MQTEICSDREQGIWLMQTDYVPAVAERQSSLNPDTVPCGRHSPTYDMALNTLAESRLLHSMSLKLRLGVTHHWNCYHWVRQIWHLHNGL